MKKLRIAYFSDTTIPQINGVSSHIEDISQELEKRGHKIGIFAPRLSGQKNSNNIHFFPIPSLKLSKKIFKQDAGFAIPFLNSVNTQLMDFSPDLIHIQTPYSAGSIGRRIAKKFSIPAIETFHGYIMDEGYLKIFALNFAKSIAEKLLWSVIIKQLNSVNLVLSPSNIAKKDLILHGLKSKVLVVPNGIKANHVRLKNDRNKSIDNYNILYFGRLSWEKSLENLIYAFSQVVDQVPKAKFYIVGDGPSKKSLEKLVKRLSLEQKIIFTGLIKRRELLSDSFFEKYTVFTTASVSENNPVSVIEAMSHGMPVVAVKGRGMDELVNKVGLLSEHGDIKKLSENLVRVLKDTSLRLKLSSNSLAKSKYYSLENCVNGLENVYNMLLLNNG